MEVSTSRGEAHGAAAEQQSAARVILQTFARRGVRVAFGVPGGLIAPVFDALADVPEIELVTTRHEAMAAFAAMGYAAASGRPALVLTTAGPGITNAITGMAAAFAEELPLIVLGGDVPAHGRGRGSLQDSSSNALDAVAMLRTVTRWSARVESASGAPGLAEQAFQIASGARPGPVFLSLPLDTSSAASRDVPIAVLAAPPALPDRVACASIGAALARARRPLLVAGNGARAATRDLRALAERLAVPVVTTPHAKGVFPESHPLHLGGIGFGGHPSASEYLASRPDVVCVVGSRLSDTTTNGWTQMIQGTDATFQIDREPLVIGRSYPITLGLVSDAALALRAIARALPRDLARPLRELRPLRRFSEAALVNDATPLHPARVLRLLQEAFPDATFTADSGEHCAFALQYLSIDEPDRFRAMVGLGSMGSGIGCAIGMRRADRSRPVVCICGDGGLAMHLGELLTCVENGIDVVFAVFNDGRWNMVHHGMKATFGRLPAALPSRVADLDRVAGAFGALAVRAEGAGDLERDRLRALASRGGPVVLDIRIDPDAALSVDTRTSALRRSAFGGAL